MNKQDLIQQGVRIVGWVLTPLLIKYGVDEHSAGAIAVGAGTLLGVAGWWLYAQVFGGRREAG